MIMFLSLSPSFPPLSPTFFSLTSHLPPLQIQGLIPTPLHSCRYLLVVAEEQEHVSGKINKGDKFLYYCVLSIHNFTLDYNQCSTHYLQ